VAYLRVSEVAARAGVPPSTVRFYERAGLLSPARRAANGYRLFDESAVGELAIIGRAKNIGMSLREIADVVAAWDGGECRVVRGRLRAHLSGKIGQVRGRIADLGAFQRRLEAALGRLPASDHALARRCGDGCGCDAALDAAGTPLPDQRLPACALRDGELDERLRQWRSLTAGATSAERDGDTIRMVLRPGALPAVGALLAAEAQCCPQARFTLELAGGQALLIAEVPGTGAIAER
jgi:DNA-binding transcriptional MerR regulator